MRIFLRRLFGTSKHHQQEEERFRENLEKLEARGKELDELGKQLDCIGVESTKKQAALTTTALSLNKTINKSQSVQAVLEEEDDDEERSSGEQSSVSI